ncbi:unnamed protein product, partial [Closterium sp. NIES-54]
RLPDGREAVAHQHRDGRGQGGERAGEVRARLRLRRHHRHRCQPWIHSQVVPNPEKTYKLHISKGTFILKQVHVHSFSEHAVNGLFAAMEAHFVHQHENDNTSLAVVGVMIRLQRHDEKSDWIDVWQSKVPAGVDTNTTIDVPQNFWMEMIDPSMGFWRYSGSLTTPACSEIVEWHVLRKAKFLSVAQGECQTGEKQSPINIVMDEAKEESAPEKFVLEYDSAATTATVINKGYTARKSSLHNSPFTVCGFM